MKKISDIVDEGIRKMPFVEEAMRAGLINYSSLARMLKPFVSKELMKDATEASILMALKRRSTMGDNALNLNPKNYHDHIGDIFVRSGLSTYTYSNSKTLTENQTQLLHEIQNLSDTYCSFTQGMYERTLIVSENLTDRVKRIFRNEQLITGHRQLSSATVKLKASNVKAYGLYYYIFKMIAWYGITIIEVISTSNEFTIVVESKDINDAFTVLMKIKSDDSDF
ncbi:aspartate kinase [Reichenbachiella versicolor]|uniref:aspartate kinase n=1 Tax=Reichenbachiella versicolor TaxID=1821036 RepID=UPI000D6DD012|nr:aspartate kinase [Reichenbachiella versicolor]